MREAVTRSECMASSLEGELAAGRGAQVERIAAYAGGALDGLLLAHGHSSRLGAKWFCGHLQI